MMLRPCARNRLASRVYVTLAPGRLRYHAAFSAES